MNRLASSTLFLAIAAAGASAQAQVNTNPATIFGTYRVTVTHDCVTANKSGPTDAPFSIVVAPNGEKQVVANVAQNQPGVPPALNLHTNVAHFTLVMNPAGTMTSNDVRVSRLDQNRAGGQSTVLQRTVRSLQGTFRVDRSNNTLLVGPRTEQGPLPNGTPSMWTHSGDVRWQTADFGQTFSSSTPDSPDIIEQVVSGNPPTYTSTACNATLQAQRISLKF